MSVLQTTNRWFVWFFRIFGRLVFQDLVLWLLVFPDLGSEPWRMIFYWILVV